jgi:hypothetical protein
VIHNKDEEHLQDYLKGLIDKGKVECNDGRYIRTY